MSQEAHLSRPDTPRNHVYSFVIGLGAMAQCCLTFCLWNVPIQWPLVGIIGLGTFTVYRWHYFLTRPLTWQLCVACGLFTALILFCVGYAIHPQVRFGLFALACVVVAYYQPLSWFNGRWISLRGRPGWKIWMIASVWVMTVVGLPALNSYPSFQWLWIGRLVEHFIFILWITLPFDIRDFEQDRTVGLQTWPHLIGIKKAWLLCYCLGAIHLLLVIFIYWGTLERILAFAIVDLLLLVLLQQNRWKESPLFYYILLDGMLFLQAFLFYLMYSFLP